MKILAFQVLVPHTLNKNHITNHIGRIKNVLEKRFETEQNVDLVVLPELCTIDYSKGSFDKLDILSEDLLGESFNILSTLARKYNCAITFGFPRKEKNRFYISQLVIGCNGEYLLHYDKLHIAQFGNSEEKPYFSRGSKLGVFKIDNHLIAIVICYDFRFPELIREICVKYNPDVFIHPVAFSRDNTFPSWHHFVICRALENQVYFISLNRAGRKFGNSIFCPPWIDYTLQPTIWGIKEEIKLLEIDLRIINSVKEKYPFEKDRLEDYLTLENMIPITNKKIH